MSTMASLFSDCVDRWCDLTEEERCAKMAECRLLGGHWWSQELSHGHNRKLRACNFCGYPQKRDLNGFPFFDQLDIWGNWEEYIVKP